MNQLLGAEGGRDLAGHEIRVDVVGLAAAAHADGRDHGDVAALLQQPDGVGVDPLDLADEPDVDRLTGLQPVQPAPGEQQGAVLAR